MIVKESLEAFFITSKRKEIVDYRKKSIQSSL
jgi:hypothetical protein